MFGMKNNKFGKGRFFGMAGNNKKKQHIKTWTANRNDVYEQKKHKLELDDDDSVMMSGDSSPTLQASIQSPNYVELPDEPRPGKITPSTHTTNSTPSPRTSKSDNGPNGSNSTSPEVEEAIEEAVPIVRTTLPSPEPRPLIERNGYKEHDRVDGIPLNNKQKPKEHDVDDDSCLIKCVYFTQQCCECTIV